MRWLLFVVGLGGLPPRSIKASTSTWGCFGLRVIGMSYTASDVEITLKTRSYNVVTSATA